jgi:hypothetical protein
VISQVFGLLDERKFWPSQPEFLEIFSQQNEPQCVGFLRKVDLLSISIGLKTAVLAEPSDQNFRPILCFLTNFEARYILFEN